MSVTIETIITCDGSEPGCYGTFADSDMRHEAAHIQRASYFRNTDKNGRWYFRNGKDFCPICWAASKRCSDKPEGKP